MGRQVCSKPMTTGKGNPEDRKLFVVRFKLDMSNILDLIQPHKKLMKKRGRDVC